MNGEKSEEQTRPDSQAKRDLTIPIVLCESGLFFWGRLADTMKKPKTSTEISSQGPKLSKIQKDRTREIIHLHDQTGGLLKKSLENIIKIGELLYEQKRSLEHGQWEYWVTNNMPFSKRTASTWIKMFHEREKIKSAKISDLTQAYQFIKSGKIHEKEERKYWERVKQLDDQINARIGKKPETQIVTVKTVESEEPPKVQSVTIIETAKDSEKKPSSIVIPIYSSRKKGDPWSERAISDMVGRLEHLFDELEKNLNHGVTIMENIFTMFGYLRVEQIEDAKGSRRLAIVMQALEGVLFATVQLCERLGYDFRPDDPEFWKPFRNKVFRDKLGELISLKAKKATKEDE